jgi:AcrR family transcriptional regulator
VTLKRRRGQELEDALLDAAWEELTAAGYGAFTIDAVAERAHTSRPVLYRRWPRRADLALAAIRHRWLRAPLQVPDTGSLRNDLIALLEQANAQRQGMAAVLSVQLGAYYQDTRTTPADVRRAVLGSRSVAADTIMQRAVDRGEIDRARLTPRVAALPFDLFRHEILMTLAPVPTDVIREIVDDIFLPLVLSDTRLVRGREQR